MNDMGLIELNEAFSAQALACIRQWGISDFDERFESAWRSHCSWASARYDRRKIVVDSFEAIGAIGQAICAGDLMRWSGAGIRDRVREYATLIFDFDSIIQKYDSGRG